MWYEDLVVKAAYSELFSLACSNDASVAEHLEFSSDSHQWNVNFLRPAHEWEVDLFTSFFDFLYSFRLRWGAKDKFFGDLPRNDCLMF